LLRALVSRGARRSVDRRADRGARRGAVRGHPQGQPVRDPVPPRKEPGRRIAPAAKLRGVRMKLLPAIDLLSGRAVRLEEGKREPRTTYHDKPVELVAELGKADRLHVVDLDGAFGETRQRELIAQIVKASPIPVEVGGGIRSRETLETVLELGAAFVVL